MTAALVPGALTDTEQPYLRPGQPLTAAGAVRLINHLRRNPGVEVLLRVSADPRRAHPPHRVSALLGPDVMVRTSGPRTYVRARVAGEPVRDAPARGVDGTGRWHTIRAAADRLGISVHWFRQRYVRSGLVPVHTYGGAAYVRREDVDRAAGLRAGGAVVAAHDWAGLCDLGGTDFDPFDDGYSVTDAITRARARREGRA